MELVPLLRQLSAACGVSGYEHQVRDLVRHEFSRYADSVRTDALGNVVALKQGSGPEPRCSIMLASHMDEIGLIVSFVDKGFLRFEQVGGYDHRVLPSQEVVVHGRRDLPGVIGMRPPHLTAGSDPKKAIPSSKLLIDTGLPADEVQALVRVGDLVTMKPAFLELKGDLVAGKALDDRASVAAVVVCLDELSRLHHEWDVYAVATVQEELGMKGAVTATYALEPDLAIAIDVTWARQPGVPDEYTYELGKGPTIGLGPNFHPKLQQALSQAARSLEMPVHLEPAAKPPGTDAHATQVSREGIPSALVSIPERNMHTPVEIVSTKDVERAGRLLAAFISRLDGAFLPGLAWDLGLDAEE